MQFMHMFTYIIDVKNENKIVVINVYVVVQQLVLFYTFVFFCLTETVIERFVQVKERRGTKRKVNNVYVTDIMHIHDNIYIIRR